MRKADRPKCDKCGQTIRVTADGAKLPIARRTGLQFVGRNLYSIDGHPGLWMMEYADDESGSPVIATRGPGKSTGGCGNFYRAVKAENIVALSYCPCNP